MKPISPSFSVPLVLLAASCSATSGHRAASEVPASAPAGAQGVGKYDLGIRSLGACEIDVRPPIGMPLIGVRQGESTDTTVGYFETPFVISKENVTRPVNLYVVDPADPMGGGNQLQLNLDPPPVTVTIRVPHAAGARTTIHVGGNQFATSFVRGVYSSTALARKAREFEVGSEGSAHYSNIVFAAYGRTSGFGLKLVAGEAEVGATPTAAAATAPQDEVQEVMVRMQETSVGQAPQGARLQEPRVRSLQRDGDDPRLVRSQGQDEDAARVASELPPIWEQVRERWSGGDEAWQQPHRFETAHWNARGMPAVTSMALTPWILLGNCIIDVRPPKAPPTVLISRDGFDQGPPIRVHFTLQTFKVPASVRIFVVDPDDPTGPGIQMQLLNQQENQLVLEVSQSQDDAWIQLNGGPRARLRSASGPFDANGGVSSLAEKERESLTTNDHLTNLELSAFGRKVRLTLRAIE